MFGKVHTTSYGLEYYLISKDQWTALKPLTYKANWTDYDRSVAEMQLANCGYAILDVEYQHPIDNEYDLDEIYTAMGI